MLAPLLRLFLLFEIFASGLLAMLLVRLAKAPIITAVLLVLCLAGLLRLSLIAPLPRQSSMQFTVREWWSFCRLSLACAFDWLWLSADVRRPNSASRHTPLLLVHGYACNRGAWWWLKSRLEIRNRHVATVTLEPLQGDIDGYAEQIAQRVNWLLNRVAHNQARRIILVGHGMGGLASLSYLRRYGEDQLDRLIILGSPISGLPWLPPRWGRNLEQMRVDSPWQQELAAYFQEMPLTLPCVICHSAATASSAHPPNPPALIEGMQHRWFTEMGHWGLLTSPTVLNELLAASTNVQES